MKAFFTDLAANLREGSRAMLFRRVTLGDLRITPDQLVALACLSIAGACAVGIAANGLDGYFNVDALTVELAVVVALLLAAFLIAKLTGEPRLMLGFPIALLAMEPFFLVLEGALSAGAGGLAWLSAPALQLALTAWFLAAALVLLLRYAPARAARGVAGFAVYLLLFLAGAWWLPPQELWIARTTATARTEWQMTVADEEVLHAQPALLEASLAALRPERRGVADIYFVGFAAHSREDVFMKEVETIGDLFRDRFDAEGRTVALINNPKTAGVVPNATATSLGRVLRHLGGIMNREEDVLVLYLTSHGTEQHRLSVVSGPLTLQEIDPRMLARMLDESGIKWRVLAVSACYAGGFIEPLKNDWTLVMTAADAKSQSFGCGAESDFTYFGRSLFDEELRETHSFTEAFGRAREAIAGLERAGKHRPSNPQIFVGAAMAGKLREIEARLGLLPLAGAALEEDR